jgi:hypothetical protein
MSEFIKPKPAEMFYGWHTNEHPVDIASTRGELKILQPQMYNALAKHLLASPTGKVVLFLENGNGVIGLSEATQQYIQKGMLPHIAYTSALLLGEGADPSQKNFAFRARIAYDALDDFRKSELMIANRLHADFPRRVEVHAEEHMDNLDPDDLDPHFGAKDVTYKVLEGKIDDAAKILENQARVVGFSHYNREQEILDQMSGILSRQDILAIASHFGQFHSLGLSKGLQERGFSPRTVHLVKKDDRSVGFDPLETSQRIIKDGKVRLPELYWHYKALEVAFFDYMLDYLVQRYNNEEASYYAAVDASRQFMAPFTNHLYLRSFIDDMSENPKQVFLQRVDAMFGELLQE